MIFVTDPYAIGYVEMMLRATSSEYSSSHGWVANRVQIRFTTSFNSGDADEARSAVRSLVTSGANVFVVIAFDDDM